MVQTGSKRWIFPVCRRFHDTPVEMPSGGLFRQAGHAGINAHGFLAAPLEAEMLDFGVVGGGVDGGEELSTLVVDVAAFMRKPYGQRECRGLQAAFAGGTQIVVFRHEVS